MMCLQAPSVSGSIDSLKAAAQGLRLSQGPHPATTSRPAESGAPMAASRAASMTRLGSTGMSLSSIAPAAAVLPVRLAALLAEAEQAE